jgi:hypothetical protein
MIYINQMTTRIIYSLVICFLLLSESVSGQAVKKIEGKVLNAATKEPVGQLYNLLPLPEAFKKANTL